jgi:hypothetical protein
MFYRFNVKLNLNENNVEKVMPHASTPAYFSSERVYNQA